MPRYLWQCTTEIDQDELVAERLRLGETLYLVLLWLGGIDRPVRTIGRVKTRLRSEGLAVEKTVDLVEDAAGDWVPVVGWRVRR